MVKAEEEVVGPYISKHQHRQEQFLLQVD